MSGDRIDGLALEETVEDSIREESRRVKGERDSRRMASVMVGWKGPPYSENLCRCVGSS